MASLNEKGVGVMLSFGLCNQFLFVPAASSVIILKCL